MQSEYMTKMVRPLDLKYSCMSTPLSELLAEKIKSLIQEQGLEAGERLPSERKLAELLQSSRAPIREALRILSSQGLLYTRHGGGSYIQTDYAVWQAQFIEPVNALLQKDVFYRYDVLETRRALESSCAWHAALRATHEDKAHIQHCFEQLLLRQQQGHAIEAAKADAQFHLAIAQASHNAVMLQVMRSLVDLVFSTVQESRRIIFQFNDQKAVEELTAQHQALMHAILDGDPQAAKQHAEQHLDYVQHSIRDAEEGEARRQRLQRLKIELDKNA